MKLIVYVLSALLLFSSASAGGTTTTTTTSTTVTVPDLQTDSTSQDALKYGVNWIFEQAANKYDISSLNIEVTQVNSINQWEENGVNYYSFDVDAENDDATITCTFNVKCDSNGGYTVVNKWSYTIDKKDNTETDSYNTGTDSYNTETDNETETPDYGTNVEIDVEVDVEVDAGGEVEVEVEVIVEPIEEEAVAQEEANNRCQQGEEVDASEVDTDSKLKDALDYGLNWIFTQAANKYDISTSDILVNQINCICTWEDNGKTYYSFDVNANNNDASINTTYNVRCDDKGNESVVNKWSYTIHQNEHTEETGSYVNEEDSHDVEIEIEVTVEEDANKCEAIDASQIDTDSHLKDALVHGINWILQKAHDKFGISDEDIVVTTINSICGWEENGNNYYSFDVEATNKDEDTVDTTYNVKCESDGDLTVVNEWKYVIHYGDNKEEENNETCEDQGTDTNEELEHDVEVDVEVTIEEEDNNKCQQGYEVDVSEVDTDSDLKDALAYGIGWIFQNAAGKYGVSAVNVEVTQVNSICKWEENGKTWYSFDVGATNNDDASVNATFNVKYDDKGNDSVGKWWYHISWNSDNNDEEEQPDDQPSEEQTEEHSDDCDSTEEQGTDTYIDNGEDVEVNVEINIEVCEEEEDDNTDNNTDNYNNGDEEDCEEEDDITDSYNTENDNNDNNNGDYAN